MLRNSHMQVSRLDISGVANGSEYLVNGGAYENQTGGSVQGGGSLSAKAGIILVSCPVLFSNAPLKLSL